MLKQLNVIAAGIIFIISIGVVLEEGKPMVTSMPFAVAQVHFEQNATDGDVEVVFDVKGGDEGLAYLKIVSPDGSKVIDFSAPEASTLGIRQFRFESPEPKDVDGLKAAYPEGVYTFTGNTSDGIKFNSIATLKHNLPSTVSFLNPKAEEESVNFENLVINWTAVNNVSSYTLELDQEELGINILVKLPGTVNKFAVPEGFLEANTEYTLSIGTVTEDDNISVVETTFTTGGSE